MAGERVGMAVDLAGFDAIKKAAQQRGITLKGIRVAAKIVQAAAKARAPKRMKSGALRQSLGLKAQKGKRGKTLALAVVGARSKVVKMVPVGKNGRMVKAVPAKYAHLVERGTRSAKPTPFLAPALRSAWPQATTAAMAAMAAELEKVMAKEAARLAKKGK